ncbi:MULTISPECIES: acyl carrier protein [unclassified Streptomyces]|uniref:acyl carrier protein n=1 Tax=unclassified Streptomyces TaxID=2593676 RepID=UPI0022B602A4|nr:MULTISPECIES: acyl carrier protein [unclassified Streptomyces]MCZ7412958.1 acyl carrier protein [Streptomyces sp. WMMC897]MCZ7434733.1 acyl carrier protein [Streptomyces sp. WMMC1477]
MDASKDAIITWCQEYVAGIVDMPVEDVDPAADFDRLGIDSAVAVSLLVEVEERYDVDLPPEALFENPNINAVAEYLHRQIQQSGV